MDGRGTGAECFEVITYSLQNGRPDSAVYYRDVARFADEVVEEGAPLRPIVACFAAPPSPRPGAGRCGRRRSPCSSS